MVYQNQSFIILIILTNLVDSLGNSRVKLTNIDDCVKKGYIKKGQNPLEIAANQLKKDNIKILHTIGGDDTNSTAADLFFI